MSGEAAVRSLVDALGDQVEVGADLSGRTTLKVGGPAAALVRAATTADLALVARICASEGVRWLILGRGSNLLVADAGWPGIVVELGREFRGVEVDGTRVLAGGAEPMPALAYAVVRHGLAGLAYGVAIPGTVGGAVRMNAGAHGQDTSEVLEWADVVRLGDGGREQRIPAADLDMTYRHTTLPDDAVVVRAAFALERVDADELAGQMAEMQRWRRTHQPLGEPSCGSVFRNPPGDSAGRLIDAAGLKGLRRGSARVNETHANFITVQPGGRAADVHAVIRAVQAEVARVFGVDLQPEVVIVGFDDEGGA